MSGLSISLACSANSIEFSLVCRRALTQNSVSNNSEPVVIGDSTVLSSDLLLMLFLPAEKGQQYLSSVEEDSTQVDHMRRARRTFCTVVTRINNASHTIGKDGKVCLV